MTETAPPQTALPTEAAGEYADDAVLMEDLARHALALARAARRRCPAEVAALLDPANVPAGRIDLLALAAAGLVDVRQPLGELLAWSLTPPAGRPARAPRRPPAPLPDGALPPGGRPRAPREHGSETGWRQHRTDGTPPCDDCLAAHAVEQRPAICRAEFARLRAAGVSATTAAALSTLRGLLTRRADELARPDLEERVPA